MTCMAHTHDRGLFCLVFFLLLPPELISGVSLVGNRVTLGKGVVMEQPPGRQQCN